MIEVLLLMAREAEAREEWGKLALAFARAGAIRRCNIGRVASFNFNF